MVFAAFYIISATSSKTAFATDPTDIETANFTVTSTRTLTLSLSNTNVSLNLTPSATGEFSSTVSNPLTITVSTNNDTGFNLNMTTTTTNLTRTTPLSGSFPVIETLGSSGSITATEFAESVSTTNKWGYSLDGTNFSPVTTSKSILSRTTADIDGSPTTANLTFGVKLNNSIPQGDYKTTLNFIATAYPIDATFDNAFSIAGKHTVTYNDKEYYRMQDMSPWICSMVASPADTTEETTETTQLIDIRDNKVYWVAKLLDGNCWMTQNLDLNLNDNVTLTSADTDLHSVASWTPFRNTIDSTTFVLTDGASGSFDKFAPGFVEDRAKAYSDDPGDRYVFPKPSEDAWHNDYYCNGNSLETCLQESGISIDISKVNHYHIGNYYTFAAAVANNEIDYDQLSNNTTMPDSICPSGWRLPVGSKEPSQSDYYNLITVKYKINSEDSIVNINRIQKAPLYFTRQGDLHGEVLTGITTLSQFRTGTISIKNAGAYYLFLYEGLLEINREDAAGLGFAIRCLAH